MKKGDLVRVRLHTGEVVCAWYRGRILGTAHGVDYQGRRLIADRKPLPWHIHGVEHCRFVGNPCVLVPAGVSV